MSTSTQPPESTLRRIAGLLFVIFAVIGVSWRFQNSTPGGITLRNIPDHANHVSTTEFSLTHDVANDIFNATTNQQNSTVANMHSGQPVGSGLTTTDSLQSLSNDAADESPNAYDTIQEQEYTVTTPIPDSQLETISSSEGPADKRVDTEIVRGLQRRMQPRNLVVEPPRPNPTTNFRDTGMAPTTVASPSKVDFNMQTVRNIPARQFFHLHHMKTGGTSLGMVIECALRRLRQSLPPKNTLSYYSLSECNTAGYNYCMNTATNTCRSAMASSVVMTFCASLATVNALGKFQTQYKVRFFFVFLCWQVFMKSI